VSAAPDITATSGSPARRQTPDAGPILYIAGDIHLHGAADGNPFPEFLDELARRPPARLVILGDLFEYWLESERVIADHEHVLGRLRALRAAGWRLDLVCGNREFAAGRRLAIASGCALHWPRLDLRLGDRRLRIVHGDRLCHDPGYRLLAAWMRAFFWRGWYPCLPMVCHDVFARFLRRTSRRKQARRAHEPRSRPSVFIDRRKVQGAARGVDTLVAGHIHQSWRRTIGGVDMILVGDWPGRTGQWIEGYADGRLEQVRRAFSG
jgi:UDP-2,3-diacylglucosamine hydrolase